jgi:DNA-binding beta-propeller fold protein YncE
MNNNSRLFRIISSSFLAGIFLQYPLALFSQEVETKIPFEQNVLHTTSHFTIMPYNRMVKSAGKVVSFGDPDLENHALDLCLLPDRKNIAIEDRYGIAILAAASNTIVSRWTFDKNHDFHGMMSTYSGITSFAVDSRQYIAWGAAARDNGRSLILIAEWDGKKIGAISTIPLDHKAPAKTALPNQLFANTENGSLYLYVVLNGNNQVVKIDFNERKIVWTAQTGVAPYGICIAGNRLYVTNWAGPIPGDDSLEQAGVPWGAAYTDPRTGGTKLGSLSVLDPGTGALIHEVRVGLHPNAIVKGPGGKFLFVSNGNSDNVSIVRTGDDQVIDSIQTGLFSGSPLITGSSPDALLIDSSSNTLYVANGMENAIAVIKLNPSLMQGKTGMQKVSGYIPCEAYPSGILLLSHRLFVTNLEARGAEVMSPAPEFATGGGMPPSAYTIHKELASISIIPVPDKADLDHYTTDVKSFNLYQRTMMANGQPRPNLAARPCPERIGEPSLFKHVVYIIKENKTYDQVLGDMDQGRGDRTLCVYGENVTPNQHKLARDFVLLDNYYASGKSSAEGHQWADAAMVSDNIERNVRAWFRSYPHRQEDALVYNKNGFIWNNALDHGKSVRVYGEACTTHYDREIRWWDIYSRYTHGDTLNLKNTSTIARIRPIISPDYPDCDNVSFPDQIRADVFIRDLNRIAQMEGDSLPELMILSLPDDHTAGTSEKFPTPNAMVADNDLALGRMVEAITSSRFWDSTVIFVTEDDSQSGWDHISPYRTISQVISPYTTMGKTNHTNYNQTSIVRTIEQILGIPPMNEIDAAALPMFDCFTSKKASYRYKHQSSSIPLNQMNKPVATLKGKARYYAKLSASRAFREVDDGDDDEMNRILWFYAKGNKKYPAKR